MSMVKCAQCEKPVDTKDAEEYKDGYLCIECHHLINGEEE